MKFENKGKWLTQIIESTRKNEASESSIVIKSIIAQYKDFANKEQKENIRSNVTIKASDLTKKYFTTLLTDVFLQGIMPELQKDNSRVQQNYKVDQVALAQKLVKQATFSVQNGYAILSLPNSFAGWNFKDAGPIIQGKNQRLKMTELKVIAGPVIITKELELTDLK